MLTIFATPRRFEGHTGIIQRNAINSWTALRPRPEIFLFGNDPGTAEVCREFDLIHVPELASTPFGAPLLSDLFEKARRLARHNLLSYVNADIILLGDFLAALRTVSARKEKFLMVGRRWDVSLKWLWAFGGPSWESELREYVLQNGKQVSLPGNSDYFVFPRSLWSSIPPLGLGRGRWDAWLVYEARRLGAAVVDVSSDVMAIHQMHDQSSYPHGLRRWRQEINHNGGLVGRDACGFCLFDATHLLNSSGIRRARGLRYFSRYIDTLPMFHPQLAAPLRVPKAVIAGVRWLRQRIALARDPVARLGALVVSKLPADGITAVLGLTDGPGAAGKSLGMRLAHGLLWGGYPVLAYDPESSVMAQARRLLGGPIEFAASEEECLQHGDVVVIAAPREGILHALAKVLVRRGRPCVVIDCWAYGEPGPPREGIEYLSWAEKW